MVQHPEVLWAQRSSETEDVKNIIYLTVNLPDIRPLTLDYKVTSTSIHFKATAGPCVSYLSNLFYFLDLKQPSEAPGSEVPGKEYAFDLDFFKEIDVEVHMPSSLSIFT
ncbi:hypothetical protein BJ165DRAFT_1433365 [Panaeolus papilionaceus]|nr:hypothetical protein BJ165DRAFT_1433365 [Panaeolus papilionaceus]